MHIETLVVYKIRQYLYIIRCAKNAIIYVFAHFLNYLHLLVKLYLNYVLCVPNCL